MSEKPKTWVEITPKQYHVKFYDTDPNAYKSSMVVSVEGERATVSLLNGERFYELFIKHHAEIFKQIECTSAEAELIPAFVPYFIEQTKAFMNVVPGPMGMNCGRVMQWVTMTRKS